MSDYGLNDLPAGEAISSEVALDPKYGDHQIEWWQNGVIIGDQICSSDDVEFISGIIRESRIEAGLDIESGVFSGQRTASS